MKYVKFAFKVIAPRGSVGGSGGWFDVPDREGER